MNKLLKVLIGAAAVALAALAFALVGSTPTAEAELPKYLGSDACLGCHTDKYVSWEGTKHAHMIVDIQKPADFPGDLNATSAEFKTELLKADLMVANMRFLARDPATGEYKYLNVQWDATAKKYVAYTGGSNWSTSCAGCHTTGFDKQSKTWASNGIGCESCHGPGRDHIKAKGDRSKIIVDSTSNVCAACHFSSGTAKEDGGRWSQSYLPGQNAHDYFNIPTVDKSKPTPTQSPKLRQYPMWAASGHANATNLLIARGDYYLNRTECIYCHSASANYDINVRKAKWDPKAMLKNDGVSCQACHTSHESNYPSQLKKDSQALCVSCHSVGRGNPAPVKIGTVRAPHSPQADMLWGTGALNVADTKGPHSGVKCVDCHMTESNHLMKVIKPADVMGTVRKDSCSNCHANSDADVRGVYLDMWNSSITLRLQAVDAQVIAIEEALKLNPNALTADEKKGFEQWRANFWYVRKDGSEGAHNFEYATKVLAQTEKEIAKIRKLLK